MQQIPQNGGIRECFVPRPGHVLCSADLSTFELCCLAQINLWLSGYSKMADAINAGEDLHIRLAARFMGISYTDALARRVAGDKVIGNLRKAAKPVNFGLPGAMGEAKLVLSARKQYDVRFCELAGTEEKCGREKVTEFKKREIGPTCVACLKLAIEYKALWFEEFPEMTPYMRRVSRLIDAGGNVEQWVSKRMRGGCDHNNGANTQFQGLAGDAAKAAFKAVSRECYMVENSPLYGCRPILFVHDETVAELPEDRASEAGDRLAQLQIDTIRAGYIPDVKVGSSPALMRRWDKDAETVRDASGKLLVWGPKAVSTPGGAA